MPLSPFNLRILALILVPIAVLLCILAVALACSGVWGVTKVTHCWWIFWKRTDIEQLDASSDHHRTSTSTKNAGSTGTDLEYQEPLRGREHV